MKQHKHILVVILALILPTLVGKGATVSATCQADQVTSKDSQDETTRPAQDQKTDEPEVNPKKNRRRKNNAKKQSADGTEADNSAKNEALASEDELYNRKREAFANPKVDNILVVILALILPTMVGKGATVSATCQADQVTSKDSQDETTRPAQDQKTDEPEVNPKKNRRRKNNAKKQSADGTEADNSAKNEALASEDELYNRKREAFANPKVDNPDLPNVLLIGDSISIGYTPYVRR